MITESQKKAMRKWREQNRKHLKEYEHNRYLNRKEIIKENRDRSEKECWEIINDALGISCLFCQSQKYLRCHEIHGKTHTISPWFIKNNLKDFVRLCHDCHRHVHWDMKYLHLTWEDILRFYSNNSS